MTKTIDRSELAIWAEGTQYTTTELVNMYADYLTRCEETGTDPLNEARWCEEELGIEDA